MAFGLFLGELLIYIVPVIYTSFYLLLFIQIDVSISHAICLYLILIIVTTYCTPCFLVLFVTFLVSVLTSMCDPDLPWLNRNIVEELGLKGMITPNQARKKWNYLWSKYIVSFCVVDFMIF